MASFYWPSITSTGVTTINGLSGAVTLAAGTGISITPSGNTLTIASTSSGDVTIGSFGSTPNANGLSISGSQVLNLQPADATHPGGLSSADWNTFNNKQAALTIGNLTDAGTDGITVTGGTGSVIGSGTSLSQHVADTTHNGYLSSTDWNTFNGKQASLTIGNLTDAGTDGITVTGGTGSVIGSGTSLAQHVADTTHNGYLSSTDWNTFNGKQAAGSYITALTGDVTASGPGSVAATAAATQNNITSIPNLATVGTVTSGTWSATTIALNKGGTGQTTKAAAFDALQPMTTGGDIIYGGASGTGTRLANGSAGQFLKSQGTTLAPVWAAATVTYTAPTVQKFTSGTSQTYTTPANVLYIKVQMVGGGGGGAGGGTSAGTSPVNGGNTVFGGSTAGGGTAGAFNTSGGAGGTATLGSGHVGTALSGATGGDADATGGTINISLVGGSGGNSAYGGGGAGNSATGGAGTTNTGGGGGGGGATNIANNASGSGGGSGAWMDFIITSVSGTYTYSVGTVGTAGGAGPNGNAGGAGAAGYIIVWEYYQ